MEQQAMNKGVRIQSVARAIEIIHCFSEHECLSLPEIAEQMQLSKSTVFGIVNTLAAYNFLEKDEQSKKYRLGMGLYEYGSKVLARTDVRELGKRYCAPLAQKYSAVVHIATHSNGGVLYLEKLVSDPLFSISSSNVGLRAPMHCTGVGKAMLAFLPLEYIEHYLHFPLKSYTPNTITDKQTLLSELEKIKQSRVAIDNEEIEHGLYCVASPVLEYDGKPALAISVSLPVARLSSFNIEQLWADVLDCAERISSRAYR